MQSQSVIRQTITDTIIAILTSRSLPPWRRPWADDPNSPGLHTSLSTGTPYRGINQLLLQCSAMKAGFKSKWWGTYAQISFNGGQVQRGQKATKIVLWKPIQRKRTKEQGKEVEDNFMVMREYSIFSVEQTTGLDKFQVGYAKPHGKSDRHAEADAVIESVNAKISYGGNRAFYSPDDSIQLPFRHQFESLEAFYETAFHELAHWAEHPTRLNWDRANEGYHMGELVAELSACQMMAELGLPTTNSLQNHAAYLKSWLEGMGRDPKYIFRAASQASKVVDYLLSFCRTPAMTPEPVEDLVLV